MASWQELQQAQPIKAERLPLPDGAATAANQIATQSPVGATAAPATATVVQGNDAGTPVPVSIRGLVVLTTGTTINISGAYNSTPPVLVDGTENNLFQLDVNANLKTVIENWPATQPVSIASMPSTPVTGTFWQATQPVSGTFWQATQPVSIASMPSTPVTGTFWQAKQPVSQADGDHVTIGAKADAKSTATDTTAITAMSVWKQISASIQAAAASLAGALSVTQSGTWTVQPGNTANTTAWKVDGSAVTQPVKNAGGTLADKSGTITTGGTAQNAAASNANRLGFLIQNNSTADLWFNTLATAVQSQPSIKLPAGAYYESPPTMLATGAISIIGATTGQAFSAREW